MFLRYFLTIMIIGTVLYDPTVKAYQPEDSSSLTVYAGVTAYPNPAYDSLTLVEFPFSINRHELGFYRADSTSNDHFAYVFAQIILFDSTGLNFDSASTYSVSYTHLRAHET